MEKIASDILSDNTQEWEIDQDFKKDLKHFYVLCKCKNMI